MPLIQIVRNPTKVSDGMLRQILNMLPVASSTMLSCSEGGKLESKDIMIEVTDFGPFDTNCKDLHVRVWAHDYPSRRGPNNKSLDLIQLKLSGRVRAYLTPDISWNVWVLLATTSYGSDTTD